MKPSYYFEVDPAQKLIRSRLEGFFDRETFDRYTADRFAAFAKLRVPPAQTVSLVDIRMMSIQSAPMVEAFSAMMTREPRSRRLALIVGSSLARMQLLRALGERKNIDAMPFEDERAALEWLGATGATK